MIKHHRVQIAPVAVRARFCVRESFSAGRAKSATPARTSPHYQLLVFVYKRFRILSEAPRRLYESKAEEPDLMLCIPAMTRRSDSEMDLGMGAIREREVEENAPSSLAPYCKLLVSIEEETSLKETYQKCTVLNPIGLSHIFLNQLCCAVSAAGAAVL